MHVHLTTVYELVGRVEGVKFDGLDIYNQPINTLNDRVNSLGITSHCLQLRTKDVVELLNSLQKKCMVIVYSTCTCHAHANYLCNIMNVTADLGDVA